MNAEEKPKLALRVFKRTNRRLVLLWKRTDGVDPLKAEITFKEIKSSQNGSSARAIKLDPQFMQIDEPTDPRDVNNPDDLGDINVSSETIICLVKEKEAGLDSTATYYVRVKYGEDEEGIRLTPAGVFPSHEREDRQKNMHLYGWDDSSQAWRKVSVVKGPKGQWALATLDINTQQLEENEDD